MSSNNILICPSYQWHQTVIHAISCPEMNDASVVSRHSKGLVDISLLVNIKDQKERRKKGHFRKFKGIWDDTNCDRVRFLSKFSCPLRPNHFFFFLNRKLSQSLFEPLKNRWGCNSGERGGKLIENEREKNNNYRK